MTDGDLVHAGRTLPGMTSGQKTAGAWLANYYLRGAITLTVMLISVSLGLGGGAPILLGLATWVGLWLAAKVREGYAGTDRQP